MDGIPLKVAARSGVVPRATKPQIVVIFSGVKWDGRPGRFAGGRAFVRIGVGFMAKTGKAQPYCKALQYREAIGNARDSNFFNFFRENCRQGGAEWSISTDTRRGNRRRKKEKRK